MAKDHGPTIKDDALYDELRKQGESKEKAARIANAKAAETIDQDTTRLEDRTRQELYDKARDVGIDGRSDMIKDQLIEAIRGHK